MKAWKVGGAVRDALLGRPDSDVDWVVTGTTPEAMRAAGYLPVGRDFPVFLHPVTKQEYALARTERKTAPGYHGFVFHTAADVTLEDDLARRDLTINAMAQDECGTVIDPHGGQRDLQARLLRHVSPAFAEDPVRILRVARFAARLEGFQVAPETQALMCGMVTAGEVDALVAERVWQELSRGLMEAQPSRMFEVLHDCGALARLLPEIDAEWRTGAHTALRCAIDLAAQREAPLAVRFAVLVHRLGQGASGEVRPSTGSATTTDSALQAMHVLCVRWRIPADCRDVAEGVLREHSAVLRGDTMNAESLVALLSRCDAWRRPERFAQMLQACEVVMQAKARATGAESFDTTQANSLTRLRQALSKAATVDAGAVAQRAAQRGLRGPDIGAAVHAARVSAVADIPQSEPED